MTSVIRDHYREHVPPGTTAEAAIPVSGCEDPVCRAYTRLIEGYNAYQHHYHLHSRSVSMSLCGMPECRQATTRARGL